MIVNVQPFKFSNCWWYPHFIWIYTQFRHIDRLNNKYISCLMVNFNFKLLFGSIHQFAMLFSCNRLTKCSIVMYRMCSPIKWSWFQPLWQYFTFFIGQFISLHCYSFLSSGFLKFEYGIFYDGAPFVNERSIDGSDFPPFQFQVCFLCRSSSFPIFHPMAVRDMGAEKAKIQSSAK